ncbi:MFS transporter [Streptomyces iconiensis]|uniref:MFS transporter n=1 Tax=Streptomyces iconiensis TaxID=1384038 RepID=A0ABT6ZYL6_9ACTN|nr:MFS transporter [Streptomyces iconiensis]MDJ1134164.1 MFS transporter [Streptomyces iconiensis]
MSQHVDEATEGPGDRPAPSAATEPKPTESVFAGPYRTLTLGVVLSVGMVAFESLGVATVLPDIARKLDGLGAYGWGLSALMLANIIGTVLAGRSADRVGPWRAAMTGMAVFALGCAVAGAATSWPLFLLGRFAQGLGVGAVMAVAYTVIGLAYPQDLRARMFALLSSAWTIPSLIGPVLAGTLADATTWRAVFLLMLPLIAIAAVLTLPGLRKLNRPRNAGAVPGAVPAPAGVPALPWWKGPLTGAVLLTAGTGLLLQALLLKNFALLVPLALLGVAIAVPALRQVTPKGTLGARPGPGAGIVIRGLLCGVYFGSEAFLPLGLQELHGVSAAQAGLGLSAGAITWVVGSALQAKRDGRNQGSRTGSVALGFVVLLAGVAVIALAILVEAVPSWIAVVGWGIGGIGMGIGFNAATTDTMEQAPAERQGEVSGALQLAQTLATGLIAGLGGAAIAIAQHYDADIRTALFGIFALTGALALSGVLLARRLRPAPTAADAVGSRPHGI